MIVIRLARYGHINLPKYRIVVTNKRSKREGKPLEVLGTWDPAQKQLKVNNEKLKVWKQKGAQISEGLTKLLT
ncbi:MAG: 30S ribosomal protein S16 [Candidatus Woesebacteria bacterium GW2011_GWB1_41_10]|uniref:Small ribosomal subunit protein bS16 n=1 Tax=Candidatus Woesebacteria bacterium GW2011_GWB1_41_10 TaxID=1618577 RepID=A0A0G0U826_9BACT|nr:MAG: 30S ribosomal protein S16 [Candidatus Woesebacteria bacterium GW2011_GWB1_41_10]